MFLLIWQLLPGGKAVKLTGAVLLAGAFLAVLWFWLFPVADAWLYGGGAL
ncbi:hypothetical protein ABZ863_17510 [Saccharomonospora sp. NPDC046836]